MTSIFDFIKRHLLYVLIAVAAMFVASFIPNLPWDIVVLLKLPLIAAFVVFLASMSLYSYTPESFTATPIVEHYPDGTNNMVIVASQIDGKHRVMSGVFIGISIVASISILAIYFMKST
jgi:hypothetical protein